MDIGQIHQSFAQTQAPAASSQGPAAIFAGHQIQLTDAVSLVANSAEEASFAMSEREEVRLSERKMKPKGPDLHRLEQVRKYAELMDRQGRQQELEQFMMALSAQKKTGPGEALRQALGRFNHPVDAYAALAYAREELGERLDTAVFTEAMDQLDDLAGKEIKTRLAAGLAASEFEGCGSAEELKDLYAHTVLESDSPKKIYERLIQDYGMDRFEAALDFLARALGNDMAATTSSTDKVQLAGIARDLGLVRQLHGLNAQCQAFSDRMQKSFEGKYGFSAPELIHEVLKLRDSRFVGAFDIESIADRASVGPIEDRIIFFQHLSQTARELSENLFPEANGRLAFIQAIQDALDDAISVEEQMYASDQ